MDSGQLLADYAATRSEEAFRGLVEQFVGLVYSACLRQLKDRHRAEDATQAVFLLLSQNARRLRKDFVASWLLTTARFVCGNMRKSESRRLRREKAVAMNATIAPTQQRSDLIDLVDVALGHVSKGDREVLIRRFLNDEPLGEIAAGIGISEEAARKRAGRGLEKLRRYFSRRGITTTSVALAAALTRHARAAIEPATREAIAKGVLQVCSQGAHAAGSSAAIAHAAKSAMLLKQLTLIAAVLVAAGVLGSGGWLVFRPVTRNVQTSPAVNSAMAANSSGSAEIPATMPATKPSEVDLSTPEACVTSFFEELYRGDRDAVYACLTADPNRTPTEMDAMLDENLAQNRLTRAAVKAFGGDGSAVRRMITLDSVAHLLGTAPAARIDGPTATIVVQIPPMLISAAPPQFQGLLREWSNATMFFQLFDGQWRFDIDRSMRVKMALVQRGGARASEATRIAFMLDTARSYGEVASEIQSGKLATQDAAVRALRDRGDRLARKYSMVSLNSDVVPRDAGAGL